MNSRIPGFHLLELTERRRLIFAELEPDSATSIHEATEAALTLDAALESGGLGVAEAASIVENVVGRYSLPYAVALNFRINGVDRIVPMVVEEPSVVAAASNAAKMVRVLGGFDAIMSESLLPAQIELLDVPDVEQSTHDLLTNKDEILERARHIVPGLVRRGAGPRDLEVRRIGPHHLVVHILIDTQDAMGANLANTVAEGVGRYVAERSGARLGLRILSNYCPDRVVQVKAEVPFNVLVASGDEAAGLTLAASIESASRFADTDTYRAVTHNKGIMNGVDSVVLATGNDYRAVEAGAHAYACRNGRYEPLSTWRVAKNALVGELKLPVSVGVVGGTLRVHPLARLSLALLGHPSARQLSEIVAAAGLASNLAALRALASEGIQQGHMSLHARSLALMVGASSAEVDRVAKRMVQEGAISEDGARSALLALRGSIS